MLYRITRPDDAPGPHELTLMVNGGAFPFTRGAAHAIEFDEASDARLLHQLAVDGYRVQGAVAHPPPAPVKPADTKQEGA